MTALAELTRPTATARGQGSTPMIAADAMAKHYGDVKAVDGQTMYGGWTRAFGVIAAWAVAIYAVLIRTLSRREA